MKSFAVADTGKTLHRAPPLMRIFFPVSLVRSYIVTRAPAEAAKYAAVSPAAPPPSTATCGSLVDPAPPDDDEDARSIVSILSRCRVLALPSLSVKDAMAETLKDRNLMTR